MTTREEARAKCIEVGAKAFFERHRNLIWENQPPQIQRFWRSQFAFAFDSLHGIITVNPLEATCEMVEAEMDDLDCAPTARDLLIIFDAMAAASDLTNAPGAEKDAP